MDEETPVTVLADRKAVDDPNAADQKAADEEAAAVAEAGHGMRLNRDGDGIGAETPFTISRILRKRGTRGIEFYVEGNND